MDFEIINREKARQQGLKRYFTGEPCRHGHVSERQVNDGRCIECRDINSRKQYSQSRDKYLERRKKHYENNKEKTLEKIKEYYENHKDEIREYKKKWREENIERLTELNTEYYHNNKEALGQYRREWSVSNRDRINKLRRFNYKTKPERRMSVFMSRCVRNILVNKSRKTVDILGYTSDELVGHLENQFDSEMSWDNYGVYGWHVDHIIPVDYFIKNGVTDPAIVNALGNLRPLWATENLSKGAKYDPS